MKEKKGPGEGNLVRNRDNYGRSLLFNDLVAHKNVTQRLNDSEERRGKRGERTRVIREEDESNQRR